MTREFPFLMELAAGGVSSLATYKAAHLLETGVNIKYVSEERLKHENVKVTADTYLRVTQKFENDTFALYERYIRK
jgi:hypothetical protein